MNRFTIVAAGVAIAASAALVAGAARAELPPYVYEQERAAADTVVVIDVDRVSGPSAREAKGLCVLRGRIVSVERGDWRPGEAATFYVACVTPRWQPMPGPFPGHQVAWLREQRRLKIWARGDQAVRRGLEPVAVATEGAR